MPVFPASPDALDDALVRAIAAQGPQVRFPAHAVIISEGDRADSLYIILSGRVKVFSSNEAGKEVVINTHGPGEYVGELALDGGPRSASVMTLEPTTCSVVMGADLRRFIAAQPDFAMHLIYRLIGRLRQATDSVKDLALLDVYGRVARTLTDLSVPDGSQRRVNERLSHQDIAERVGSSREMVSRILGALAVGGYVELDDSRNIRIVKPLPARW
jgi:CRP/FNR family cyclic AMP-dependent transcriptional regulator